MGKGIQPHVIGFAISIVAGYFVNHIKLDNLFNIPIYFYKGMLIFIGIIFFYQILLFLKYLIVSNRDSKQLDYYNFNGFSNYYEEMEGYWYQYADLGWEVAYNVRRRKVEEVSSAFCSKDDCKTQLNIRRTFLGRYLYKCPRCFTEIKKDESPSTFRNKLEKIADAELKKAHKKDRNS